jgi:hypothetical protein
VVRAEAEVAWRAKKRTAGRATAAAGRRVARGSCRQHEVALELLRRRAAARGGSGRQPGGVAGQEEASARPGSGGAGAGAARGRPQGGSGAGKCTAHGRQSGGGARQRNRGEGERGRRRRT